MFMNRNPVNFYDGGVDKTGGRCYTRGPRSQALEGLSALIRPYQPIGNIKRKDFCIIKSL